MADFERERVADYCCCKNYRLRVELLDLNMLNKHVRDGSIQVEVSMGLQGDSTSGRQHVPLGSSITVPHRPTSDGSDYWFVSWEEHKPCLELNTKWEDIDFRCVCVTSVSVSYLSPVRAAVVCYAAVLLYREGQ